jgi:hypothetical protein
MKSLFTIAAVALLFAGTGCATAIRGDKQKAVRIETEPTGATLTLNGKEKFTTPADLTLKRKEVHTIEIAKEGYQTVRFNFGAQWDGLSMTSFVLPGGSLLFATDTATGADKQFNKLATVKLPKAIPGEPVLDLYEHRGQLYTKVDYDRVLNEESKDKSRFMGSSSD